MFTGGYQQGRQRQVGVAELRADLLGEARDGVEAFNAAHFRLCRSRALLAARRGHVDTARSFLDDAFARQVDPFHQLFLDAASAEVHLIAGDWQQAALAALEALRVLCDDDSRSLATAVAERQRRRQVTIRETSISCRLARNLRRIYHSFGAMPARLPAARIMAMPSFVRPWRRSSPRRA